MFGKIIRERARWGKAPTTSSRWKGTALLASLIGARHEPQSCRFGDPRAAQVEVSGLGWALQWMQKGAETPRQAPPGRNAAPWTGTSQGDAPG